MMKADSEVRCYHCGEPVPPGCYLYIKIDNSQHQACCAGCKAVAEFIMSNGLDNFYRHRENREGKVDPDMPEHLSDWVAFDDEEYWGEKQKDGKYRLAMITEGIHCAACVWLLRTGLTRRPGVTDVQIDLATGFTRIDWDPEELALSDLLCNIQMLGYRPHLLDSDTLSVSHEQERRRAMTRLLVAGLGMMQVMMFATGLYAGDYQGIGPGVRRFLEAVSMLVATPVVLYSARPFFSAAWNGLRARTMSMDVPVSLAIALAYFASVSNFMRGQGALYFDSVVMFVFFLLLARYIDMQLRHRSLNLSHAMIHLLPELAHRVGKQGAEPIPVSEVRPDDHLLVPRGSAIPADGCIVSGQTFVDESFMSGESRPLPRLPGDKLLSGSINLAQPVTMKVDACGKRTALSKLHQLLLEAQIKRPQIAILADRIAGWFVSTVLLLTIATAAFWVLHDPQRAFEISLAMLVVTCPCALSLATPAALAAAGRRLLQQGVLISRSSALESLAGIDTIIFDKTGTLTMGDPELGSIRLHQSGHSEQSLLAIAAALEKASEHPLAKAFDNYKNTEIYAEDTRIENGGLSGIVDGQYYRLGNLQLVPEAIRAKVPDSDLSLADSNGLLMSFSISDSLRPGAAGAIAQLQSSGYQCMILSGDAETVVADIANRLGIKHWESRQSANDKLSRIRNLQQQGRKVLMVGDGVNDAPVLAGADVSMAVSGAAHLARSSADMIINSQSLSMVPECIKTASRTRRVIRQNLVWAGLYNLAAIPLAATGNLAPWMAALGMSFSSLIVVLNAGSLARSKQTSKERPENIFVSGEKTA